MGPVTAAVVAFAAVVLAVIFALAFSRTYDGQMLLKAFRGEISFDGAITRIILEHRTAAFGVPVGERRKLEETLPGIPDRLEGTAESDRRELADTLLEAGADGRITDGELAEISAFIEEITK
ncbi:MAG: hypothetical protein JSW52_11035 [Candidatus Coatesbacteria bacterium]|nr:MAG: hypothetical protein JSW52_11035 [Candidatus Coatesbacteria bacterium]